jgi:hypothetical protein
MDRFDLINENAVRIADYKFGRDGHGDLNVWIEATDKGPRFLSQIVVPGETYQVRTGSYTQKCYILRDKTSGSYYFLDLNDCGFWLHSERFSGAHAYRGDETAKIQKWLAAASEPVPCELEETSLSGLSRSHRTSPGPT